MTRHDDFEHDPIAPALRASLEEHAAEAPDAGLLAERIIHAADRRPGDARTPRHGWRTWALPLVAAGAVGVVVAAVAGIQNANHTSANRQPSAGSRSLTGSPPEQSLRRLPAAEQSAEIAAAQAAESRAHAAASATSAASTAANRADVHDVTVLDLTFTSADEGWALASSDCIGAAGRCTAMLHTTDGGAWYSVGGEQFNVAGVKDCAGPCVSHVRFANAEVGYVYGPTALFMTTNGGASWTQQPGGAEFVETLNDNVIRVTSSGAGCPGPCNVQVETAAIGSAKWTTATLGGTPSEVAGLSFARGGSDAYLLFTGHAAGGGENAQSTLYRSGNDGTSWRRVGEPCPQVGGEVDSTAVAGAPGGRASVLCTARQAPNRSFVATSADGGEKFHAHGGTVPAAAAGSQLTGDPQTVLVSAATGLARSVNGGRTWTVVPGVSGGVTFVGFESAKVGRAVADGGRVIWTTRNGGSTWTEVALP